MSAVAELEPVTSPTQRFYDSLRGRGPSLNLLFEQARIALDREDDTILRDAFAGTIAVVLNDMLRSLHRTMRGSKSDWKNCGPRIAGHSIAQIVGAAAENYRHYELWDVSKPDEVWSMRSARILADVLGLPAKKSRKQPPFRGNVCWAVLDTVTGGTGYTRLDALVREFAGDLSKTVSA
jgi:hypothetical protein